MKLSSQIKSISYLKAHASDVVLQVREQREPMIITQNGEAKMVVQDIESYEETQEVLAMLKILALGKQQIEKNKVTPADSAIRHIRKHRKQHS
jgi:prevent-host-death family protein